MAPTVTKNDGAAIRARVAAKKAGERAAALKLCNPVGTSEIAELLGVEQRTVLQWRHRGLLPEPRWWVGNGPAWDWAADVLPWAQQTGRA